MLLRTPPRLVAVALTQEVVRDHQAAARPARAPMLRALALAPTLLVLVPMLRARARTLLVLDLMLPARAQALLVLVLMLRARAQALLLRVTVLAQEVALDPEQQVARAVRLLEPRAMDHQTKTAHRRAQVAVGAKGKESIPICHGVGLIGLANAVLDSSTVVA